MNTITRETRQESHLSIDKNKRYTQFINLLKIHPEGLTVREIMQIENLERNQVAPRITELQSQGKIEAIGKRLDKISGKSIAVYKLKQEDKVKHIVNGNVDYGYKMKCENCEYGMEERNEKMKITGYFCKKLKGNINTTQYIKMKTCSFFLKKT